MIKFLDLKKINDSFQPELNEAVVKVVNSGWYLLGDETRAFERAYATYTGTTHCIGVANGLDALRMIFRAYIEMGVMKAGDEVIVPANTFIATILAITDNDLVPILVEPDNDSYNLDASLVEEKITARTRAIVIVHLYGQIAMNQDFERLRSRYDLKLIEDNAQAIGATYQNQRAGSLGDAAGHSFYPGKNLGALGDGGAVTTSDDQLATMVRAIGNYGSAIKYQHDLRGLNSRLDEIQAAVLNVKLKRLDQDNKVRQRIASIYRQKISNEKIGLPLVKEDEASHVWHLFVIRTSDREKLMRHLEANNIQCLIHYPTPPHKQKAYSAMSELSFPITERIHREVLSLPISPVMSETEAAAVVDCLNSFK